MEVVGKQIGHSVHSTATEAEDANAPRASMPLALCHSRSNKMDSPCGETPLNSMKTLAARDSAVRGAHDHGGSSGSDETSARDSPSGVGAAGRSLGSSAGVGGEQEDFEEKGTDAGKGDYQHHTWQLVLQDLTKDPNYR